MRNIAISLKFGFLALALGCVMAGAPRNASAALSLQVGIQGPEQALLYCTPGRHAVDLFFIESAPVEDEMLRAYDLGLRLVQPPGQTAVSLDGIETGGPGFVLGDDPAKYTFTVAESDANHVLANVSSNNDLFDIISGKNAARLFYTVAPDAPLLTSFWFSIAFDPALTVFGSGDPSRGDPTITIDLSNGLTVVCPEPAGMGLLGMAGLLVLRRRRNSSASSARCALRRDWDSIESGDRAQHMSSPTPTATNPTGRQQWLRDSSLQMYAALRADTSDPGRLGGVERRVHATPLDSHRVVGRRTGRLGRAACLCGGRAGPAGQI